MTLRFRRLVYKKPAVAVAAYPTVEDVTRQFWTSNTTSHLVNMPATVNAGDLLMTIWCSDGTVTVATPAGWTEIIQETDGSPTSACIIKVADGTEAGTTVDFVTSTSQNAACQTYRIKTGTWGGTTSDVEATSSHSSGATPDPPSHTASWGALSNLWFATEGSDIATVVNSYPADFTDGIYDSATTTGTVTVGSCRREYNASDTLDPGTFTIATARFHTVMTIVVKPAA